MKRISSCIALLLLTPVVLAQEEYQERFAQHTVHYSVFPSTVLQPEVAAALGFSRAGDRMLINIAVVDNAQPTAGGRPAEVSGTATNLLQQQTRLKFVAVSEQGVAYYLAPLRTSDRDVWRFDIEVDPPGPGGPYRVKFQKKLYID